MGYEILYAYHERLEEGGYDRNETKTLKRQVGEPFEDVSLERLAATIMAQMARRDIWVVNAEVFELAKKKISFKETNGGIILKNKKFILDQNTEVVGQDLPPEAPQIVVQQPATPNVNLAPQVAQMAAAAQQQPAAANVNLAAPVRPLKWMIFDPELIELERAKQKNLKFTVGTRYPVFEEKPVRGGLEVSYVTKDDLGRSQTISEVYFVPANQMLYGDKELGFSKPVRSGGGDGLSWGGAVNDDMPSLRP